MKIFTIGDYKIVVEETRTVLYKEDKLIFCLNGCVDVNEFIEALIDTRLIRH